MAKINSQQLEELKSILPPFVSVVTPASENYAASIKRFAPSAEKPAGAVIYPTSSQDVSLIVKFAVANGIHMTVSCGGHATSGSSSSDGGIVIDLGKMKKAVVDEEKKTLSIGGGALWEDADVALGKYGLATVGGTVNHTGVGGLALGGGYGWLSGQYGMTVDNILEVEYVLADGSIVTCNSTHEPDLFWAARGAGQAFGVATNFVLQAYEQKNEVFAGILVFSPTQLRPIIEICNNLIARGIDKSTSMVAFMAMPPDFHPVVGVLVFYNGSEEEAKAYYEPLFKLNPLVNMTSMTPYEKVNGQMNEAYQHGIRRVMKGSALIAPIDPSFAQTIWDDYMALRESHPDMGSFGALFEYISPRKIIEVPQTATAFANRGAYQNVLFVPSYTLAENDAFARKWAGEIAAKTKKELNRMLAQGTDEVTKDGVGEYLNYADIGDKGRALFGVNFPRLVELKKKYDPKNVFGKNLNLV